MYFPGAQETLHDGSPAEEYRPTLQLTQDVALSNEKVPAVQFVHCPPAVDEKVPAAQLSQAGATPRYLPAGQVAEQVGAASGENCPEAQLVQSDRNMAPGVAKKFPAAHEVQADDPGRAAYFPETQLAHAAEVFEFATATAEPAAQSVQLIVPVEAANFPGGQSPQLLWPARI